ncbi:MAG: hypothetical protein A2527_02310 [Candidatus Lambdaproteobacteria bacterium RIFOXYD2_FULL_50_16]|uniref:Uncharacterized protein n=1 Tax=Candidatus Lambdaproteobacteria bacterium RIFOXYD2_FULL_50_16 TaxID=1817772 RepID=A0A1F6GDV5_9PROT|nr:MAG: hypothetical protein A2527_02310 [Candidatus Lambdaproteobacteria bacterium RIFOXYD2_FULL_50_16]
MSEPKDLYPQGQAGIEPSQQPLVKPTHRLGKPAGVLKLEEKELSFDLLPRPKLEPPHPFHLAPPGLKRSSRLRPRLGPSILGRAQDFKKVKYRQIKARPLPFSASESESFPQVEEPTRPVERIGHKATEPEEEEVPLKNLSEGVTFLDWALHLGLCIVIFALEYWVISSLVDDVLSPAICIFIHLLLCALLFGLVRFLYLRTYDIKYLLMISIFTFGMGPFGPVICVMSFVAFRYFIGQRMSFAEWFETMFPDEEHSESEEVFHRIVTGQDDFSRKDGMMSFNEVFIVGTIAEKRNALTKIAKHFRREFAPALRAALEDETNSIRVQAATVTARIEQGYMTDLMRLTKKHDDDPEDADALLALAKQADSYVFSGILDDSRKKDMLVLAVGYYRSYLELRPDDYKIRFTMARLELQAGMWEAARDDFWHCIKEGGMDRPNIRIWHLQTLFQLGQIREMHRILAEYKLPVEAPDQFNKSSTDIIASWQKGLDPKLLLMDQI